jgi:hypothetical protein
VTFEATLTNQVKHIAFERTTDKPTPRTPLLQSIRECKATHDVSGTYIASIKRGIRSKNYFHWANK